MHYSEILLKPHITEKVTDLTEDLNKVVFIVHKDANKIQIKQAVEEAFKVKVTDVSVAVKKPRKKTFARRRARLFGTVSGHKKAYVTLAPGDKIEFFEGV